MRRPTRDRPQVTRSYARNATELDEGGEEELINLRKIYQDRTGYSKATEYFITAVDIAHMTIHELKSLTNFRFTRKLDFHDLDVSAPFTTKDLNNMYPGAVDEDYLREKLTLQSLLTDRSSDQIPTQQGEQKVVFELRTGTDVEDLVRSKAISQGVTMQLLYQGGAINQENTKGAPIQSDFVE